MGLVPDMGIKHLPKSPSDPNKGVRFSSEAVDVRVYKDGYEALIENDESSSRVCDGEMRVEVYSADNDALFVFT